LKQQSIEIAGIAGLLVTANCGIVFASTCTISPATPTTGQTVTVTYKAQGGPLADATPIQVHRAINNGDDTAAPDQAMTYDAANRQFTLIYTIPHEAYIVEYAFHNTGPSVTWDNNNKADWKFAVTPSPVPRSLPQSHDLPPNASKAHVMMQGFFDGVPSGGVWYDAMATKAALLRNMREGQGIDRLWFPPPSKGAAGAVDKGYDPYDYYDLGNYNQLGTTATLYGTQEQLKSAIATYHAQGILCMCDLVLNHRGNGAAESNPNAGGASTRTDYSRVASGKCTWNYDKFHPSSAEISDENSFDIFPDVCYATGDGVGDPHRDLIEWAKWLTNPDNAGFDGGWRFDFAKGYPPSVVVDFRKGTHNAFGIGEYWTQHVDDLDPWVKYSAGTPAFDFPLYYTLQKACSHDGNMADLVDPAMAYAARNPDKAVTFVANHDTDLISPAYKMLAYAFILTYQGYPCIFWHDYFDNGLATLGGQTGNGINALVWVRGALCGGHPTIHLLKSDNANLLVYGGVDESSAAPGYIVALNNGSSSMKAAVSTNNAALKGKTLKCYAWYSPVAGQNSQPADVVCSATGDVVVQAPSEGYAIYSR